MLDNKLKVFFGLGIYSCFYEIIDYVFLTHLVVIYRIEKQ